MPLRTHESLLRFLEEHGAVLESAKGPLPNFAEEIAGEKIKGSWWGHPAGASIFELLSWLREQPDVLVFKLARGKLTYVHRRLWPPLVALATRLGVERLAAVDSEHTESGAHRSTSRPLADWADSALQERASKLTEQQAIAQIGSWIEKEFRK